MKSSPTRVFPGPADYFVLVLIAAKRAQLADMLMNFGQNILDPRGRLLPRSYDVLGEKGFPPYPQSIFIFAIRYYSYVFM